MKGCGATVDEIVVCSGLRGKVNAVAVQNNIAVFENQQKECYEMVFQVIMEIY